MGEGAAAGAWAGTCDGAGAGAGAGLGGGGAARCIGAEARGGEAARPLRGILALVLKQESRTTLELTETDHYSNGIQHDLKNRDFNFAKTHSQEGVCLSFGRIEIPSVWFSLSPVSVSMLGCFS